MKTINLDGISYIEHVPGATNEWYYGIEYEHGDLYEAEDIYKEGNKIKGRTLRLVHYPDGEVFDPVPKTECLLQHILYAVCYKYEGCI